MPQHTDNLYSLGSLVSAQKVFFSDDLYPNLAEAHPIPSSLFHSKAD
jgi:hypothetical protein